MAASMNRSVLLVRSWCKLAHSANSSANTRLWQVHHLSKCVHHLNIRCCASSTKQMTITTDDSTRRRVQKISKAMQDYLEKAEAHESMLAEHTEEFEMGRRYLANMMGADPGNFTQENIDEAISYLLPSGLFSKKARPKMKPPIEIFPPRKAAEFDTSGRPYHFQFYTGLPNYYDALHSVATKIASFSTRSVPEELLGSRDFLSGTEWLNREKLEALLVEKVTDNNYNEFVLIMGKLAEHPKAVLEKDFLLGFRQPIASGFRGVQIPAVVVQPDTERRHATAEGRRKKLSKAEVTVLDKGTGKFSINGKGLDEFPELSSREQLISPLVFVNKLGRVDVEGRVEGVGESARAGAVRLALSRALAAFEDEDTQEQMRQAGLLTVDPRSRERKKPGQLGARKKKTWKKR